MPKRKANLSNETSSTTKKDIRSYFTTKKTPVAVAKVDLSDDDVIPESPNIQIIAKKKTKKRVLNDSSDEEIFTVKEKKKSAKNKESHKFNTRTNKSDEATLQEVKVVDLFGKGPIKRTEPIVKREKKTLKTELGIHDDEEFEKSLLEIDAVDDNIVLNDTKKEKDKSPVTSNHIKTEYSDKNTGRKSPQKYFSIKNEKSPRTNGKADLRSIETLSDKSSTSKTEKSPGKNLKVQLIFIETGSDKSSNSKNAKTPRKQGKAEFISMETLSDMSSTSKNEESPRKRGKVELNSIETLSDKSSKSKNEESTRKKGKAVLKSIETLSDKSTSKNEKSPGKKGKPDVRSIETFSDKSLIKNVSDTKMTKSSNKFIETEFEKESNPDVSKTNRTENSSKSDCEKKKPKVIEIEDSVKSPGKSKVLKKSSKDQTPLESSSTKSKTLANSCKMSKNKRPFSEFIDDNGESHEESKILESKKKKKKLDESLNHSVVSDEERFEKKRYSAALYQNYLNRSGPKHLGSKEIPEGAPNCLKDCAFLLTGVLDSFERDEVAEAITKYGGTVKSGISKKVTHVLAGDDAGPAKIAKAEDLGIKIINEDEFLKLILELSNKDAPKSKTKDKSPSNNKDKTLSSKRDRSPLKEKSESSKKKTKVSPEAMKSFEDKIKKNFYAKSKETETKSSEKALPTTSKASYKESTSKDKSVEVETRPISNEKDTKTENQSKCIAPNSQMWVEKYKPQNIKQIIGQHGDASNVKKLMNWLTKWYINRKEKIPKPSPWAKNDDGAYFKAALLSGPPGIGKTTTVSLVCKELGFDTVEFNASDTRSKTLIKGQIGELLTTTSLSGFAKGDTGKKAVTKKHVLVMDEVDGMAGNEDRGGLQELISLIKTTGVPVICMCNDRNSEKMRSLVNYCYDLKFSRPRVDQIKAAMLSVCCREGIKIPPDAITQLIIASNQDIRQTLNSLSMWAINPDLNDAEKLKDDAHIKKKDLKLGPWEAVRKVFSAEDHKTMSINDKSDLFFYDYSIAPLFVQENYLNVTPHCPKEEMLQRFSEAADSISLGDIVEARIRRSQAWNLLPMQAMYSSVIPGTILSGHVSAQIQFPGWLGKNSRKNKMHRLAQEIHAHTRLSTTGSKSSIFLDYAKALRDAVVTPLVKDKTDGIQDSIEVLNSYHLLREDLDSLTELAMWPGQRDPMILVESKVKAAMTRAYNKQAPALPHAAASFSKGKRNKDSDSGDNEMEDDDVDDDSAPENDAMIKVKKKTETEKAGTSKGSKGKKGKGK